MDPDNLVIKLILNGGGNGEGGPFSSITTIKTINLLQPGIPQFRWTVLKKISPSLPVHGHRSHFLYNLLALRQSTKPRHTQTHTAIQTVKKNNTTFSLLRPLPFSQCLLQLSPVGFFFFFFFFFCFYQMFMRAG